MQTIDLFCGCGGMSLGFQMAGFEIVAAFENWSSAVSCYQQNFKHPVFNLDLSYEDNAISIIKNFSPSLIIGGPPCQDFSNAGKRTEGARAELTYSFAKIVTSISPKFFVMENVARAADSITYKKARDLFIDSGYGLTEIVLDASFCNVPQKRKRFFCIGGLGEPTDFLKSYLESSQSILPLTIREYYKNKNYQLPFEYYYRHPRSYRRRGIFSVDSPAPTIRGVNRPKPNDYKKHPGDPTSPENVRSLTTQERARLQTFPDSFVFPNNSANAEQMIGNAVPVELAFFVAKALKNYILGVKNSSSPFVFWLITEKRLTDRVARNIVSTINRANKIIPIISKEERFYLTELEKSDRFQKFTVSVQLQTKRALNYYYEYLSILNQ